MSEETWTILKLIKWTSDYFEKHEIENPRLNVEYLIGKTTALERFDLYLNYDRILTKSELAEFREYVKRRKDGEPLQYILGETNFFGYPIIVKPGVLIPRPETELLVENIISALQDRKAGVIADLGTGSGCIAIALALELKNWKVIATDISKEALKIAEENARVNGIADKIQFIHQDMKNSLLPEDMEVDVFVSNPPYVSMDEYSELPVEVRNFEPPEALHDGLDGLSFYKRILTGAPNYFKNESGEIFFELGHQSINGGVNKIAKELGYTHIEVYRDYAQINRIMKVNYEKKEVRRTTEV